MEIQVYGRICQQWLCLDRDIRVPAGAAQSCKSQIGNQNHLSVDKSADEVAS